jgi:hypothetical protein
MAGAGAATGAGARGAGAATRAGTVGAGATGAGATGPGLTAGTDPAAAGTDPAAGASVAAPAGDPQPGAASPAAPGEVEAGEEERRAAEKRIEEAQARREAPLGPKERSDALHETALPSVAGRPVRGYAQQGIVELGGSFSFVKATNFVELGFAPTAGWFFIDNVALTLIPQVNYVNAGGSPAKIRTVVLVEPGFHMQMSGPLFAFFGAGVGVAYEKEVGAGLALSPRAGLKVLVGGSGVLTTVFEYVYSANQKSDAPTVDDPNSASYGVRAGYGVAW